jgi:hypothetical protein
MVSSRKSQISSLEARKWRRGCAVSPGKLQKTDEDTISTTCAEDVPIKVMDTHTMKKLGAFAHRDIQDGAFVGE